MKHSRLKLLLFLMVISIKVPAQFDSIVNDYQKEFDTFKMNIEQEHQDFKNKNDSVFAVFLKDSWEKFNVFYAPALHEEPKPDTQPKHIPVEKEDTLKKLDEIVPESTPDEKSEHKKNSDLEKKQNTDVKKTRAPDNGKSGEILTPINYYGFNAELPLPRNLPHIKKVSSNEITNYFTTITKQYPVNEILGRVNTLRNQMNLNDWGYLKLLQAVSEKIYNTKKEQNLLLWVMLLNSGYNAKIGYIDNNIYLLVPTTEKVYSSWFITNNNQNYYLLTDKTTDDEFPELSIHKANYPNASSLSLKINKLPVLDKNLKEKHLSFKNQPLNVTYCRNLIDFMAEYPMCDIEVFFSAPLSEEVQTSLKNYFDPILSGLSQKDKVEVLLEFTQTAFAYQTDHEQFKREKVFFPDEMFHYPYSDCEDRSVLFSKLVKQFTGLQCIGLDFPGHINTAVAFTGEINGIFVNFNNKRYYVCDPTYINAPVGLLPDEFMDINPKIITFK